MQLKKIGIIGLGYVGIPLAVRISEVSIDVLGFDIVPKRIDELNAGKSPIKHIPDTSIAALRGRGFEATNDFSRSAECDALIICVPTPLDNKRNPDLGFIIATMEMIAPYFRENQLLSLESTTWPGTTEEVVLPYLKKTNLKVGENFFLVYSPEREDPGNLNFKTRAIPKIVGGYTERCLEAGSALYGRFVDRIVPVSSTKAAEMVKLLENIHRSINIGLVNELKLVTDCLGLDIFEIIDAAATKPFGFTPYYPGPGIGGHCIPVDPFYLTWKAREFGLHTRFIELAGEINAAMPQYVVNKVIYALSCKGKPMRGSKILVLGIAYKKDVDDMRESPSVLVMELLRDWGVEIHYSDPNVAVFPEMREHKFDLSSVEITAASLAQYDAILLLTNHSDFDYDLILEHSALIIDSRGHFRGHYDNVVRA
jgi:UDP-N-acetyl-D-glucosamine dehydrogenase